MLKFEPEQKYTTIAIYSVIVLASIIIICFTLFNLSGLIDWLKSLLSIISPFIYGFAIAYICNPVLKFFYNKVFNRIEKNKPRRKTRRILSIIFAYLVIIFIISIFMYLVIPQVVKSYNDLQDKIGGYVQAAQAWADNFVRTFPLFNGEYSNLSEFMDVNEISSKIKEAITNSYNLIEGVTDYIISYSGRFVIELKNILLGIILSVYFLLSKDKLFAQIKKICTALLKKETFDNLSEFVKFTDRTFGGFIIGKILDSLIIGLITFIVLAVFNMPYYPLVSVIVGVTNVIPFFGPFIGAIPSAFIIFIADPYKTIWFLLIILLIQQLDGNVIGPKILGDSTGLSALWVIVSITLAGGLFGITGMFIGVPTFAVIYALVKKFIEKRLAVRGKAVDTSSYYSKDADVPPDSDNIKHNNLSKKGGKK